jgi:putative intracellular protease/amidase
MRKTILFITTSHTRLGQSGKTTGIWAEEVGVPYLAFSDAGFAVDIASPAGGQAPFDPGSIKPVGQNSPAMERFLQDPRASEQVQHTLRLSEVDVGGYDAVFFPGGHGAMWDLPSDPLVAGAIETAWEGGKVVGAVCHGVAALVAARTADGQPLVAGKRVNSFTDDEEQAAGLSQVVPFLLEARLRELGSHFEKAPNWQRFAVRDGQLVTGQNPASSGLVAELVLEALAKPAARTARAA